MLYLDPPNWGCEGDYGPGVFEQADFERANFERLADLLATIAGSFILSINDTPGAREVFGRFAIEAVPVTYTIGGRTRRWTARGRGDRAGLDAEKGSVLSRHQALKLEALFLSAAGVIDRRDPCDRCLI